VRKFGVILLCLVLCSCTNKYQLPDKWKPLETVIDRPGYGEDDWWTTTLGSSVFVADLDAWLDFKKPGGSEFEATMRHERVHAIRQEKIGLVKYVWKYLTDQKFRWHEEQLGWYVGLRTKDEYGVKWDIKSVVDSLRNYWPSLGSRPDIQAWVTAVKNKKWRPEPGELPKEYEDL